MCDVSQTTRTRSGAFSEKLEKLLPLPRRPPPSVPLLCQLQYRPNGCASEPKDFPADLATHALFAFVFLNPGKQAGFWPHRAG